MDECHRILYPLPPPIAINPTETLYTLGQHCKQCNLQILHHESISVCGCLRFCHRDCLLGWMREKNEKKNQPNFQCKDCKRSIQTYYQIHVRCVLQFRPVLLAIIVICLALFVMCCWFMIKYQQDLLTVMEFVLVEFGILLIASFAIIEIITKREFDILDIAPTNLDFQTSAFLQLQRQLQDTNLIKQGL